MRNLDNDYHTWRQDRYRKFADEFNSWRASRSGGHFHGGVQIVPILLLSALIGIGAAAAWSAIAARRRRPV